MNASSIKAGVCEIQTDEGRKFQLKIQVPQQFYGQISGAQDSHGLMAGVTTHDNYRKWLQQQTSTSVLVPRSGAADTSIIIEGNSKIDVLRAKGQIDFMVNVPRISTHFLSVSCANEEIKSSFLRFKDEVLQDSAAYDESLFEEPEQLHLKIAMLVLPDDQDTVIALECLEECKKMIFDKFLQDGPLQVTVAGIRDTDGYPSVCRVLYANVVSEKMQQVANEVAKFFEIRGMIKLEEENVKLRVPMMNASFGFRRTDLRSTLTLRWNFNATRILEKFGDFHFGTFTVKEIHLSKLCALKGLESAGVITF